MHQTATYLIWIAVPLTAADAGWFEGLAIYQSSPTQTILLTPAIDQTALHGILATLRDLAIPLLAVQQLASSAPIERSSS
jgi:hypothetical protein